MAQRKNEAAWVESRHRWQIKVQSDGERKMFTSSTPGKKGKIEAEKKADSWLEHRLVSTSTRCDILLDQFVAKKEASTSSVNSSQISYYVRDYIRPVIGHIKVSSLTENDLQRIIDKAYASGLYKKTLMNIRATISGFMKYCRKAKVTTLFPEDLDIPRSAKKKEKVIAQPDDLKILFKESTTVRRGKSVPDRYIHAYRVAVLTGLRPGELLGLKWSDIKDNVLRVRRSFNDNGEITDGKNENSHRQLVITGLADQEFQAQRKMLMADGLVSSFIFPNEDATPTQQKRFRRAWFRFCETHNMTRTTPYELRHTFVSMNDEMPDGLKKKAMGHSQNMDTEGVYGHLKDGDLERIAEYSNATVQNIIKSEEVGT